MFKGRIRIRKPDLQSRLLMIWLCELFALTITRYVLSHAGMIEGKGRETVLWCVASIAIIYFLLNIDKIESWRYVGFVTLFLTVILSMIISILANPELKEYFIRDSYGIDRILRPDCALYAFLFFSMFDDPKKILKNITIFAYLDFIYLIVVELVPVLSRGFWIDIGPSGQEIHSSYNLSFGYAVAFPTIVFIYHSIKEKQLHSTLLSLAGIWCVVTQGSRGSLLVLFIFCGLMIINNIIGSENTTKKMFKIIGILLGLLLIATFGNLLLDYASAWLTQSGISSRNLEKLINGSFSDDNGRELIWSTAINAIRNGGLFGHGMLGDRPYVSPIHIAGYSHNLFLELLVSYGIIGAILIIFIIVDAIRMIFFCKDNDWRELYIILFSVSCQLMLSMSFWYVWEFWAAAAVAYRYRKLNGRRGYIKYSDVKFSS